MQHWQSPQGSRHVTSRHAGDTNDDAMEELGEDERRINEDMTNKLCCVSEVVLQHFLKRCLEK